EAPSPSAVMAGSTLENDMMKKTRNVIPRIMIGNCTRRRPIRLSTFSMAAWLTFQEDDDGETLFRPRARTRGLTFMTRRLSALRTPIGAAYFLTPTPRKERPVVGTGAKLSSSSAFQAVGSWRCSSG